MRYLIFAVTVFIALFCAPACLASGDANQAPVQSHTTSDQTWLIGQIIELQTKSAKLEATLQQQNVNSSDLKSAVAELNRLQIQLVEVKEKLSAQAELQAKELANYDRRIGDVSWNTNMWGLILTTFGIFITVAAIVLGFAAKNRAISEARDAAHNLINTESQILLGNQEERFNLELEKHSNKFGELHDQLEIQGKLLHVQTIFDRAREFFYEKNYEASLIAFDKVVDFVKDSTDARLKAFACRAFFAKGVAQGQLNQQEQEIHSYDALIAYVGDDKTPALREPVAKAYNGVGFALLCQSKQLIQIGDFEGANKLLTQALQKFELAIQENVSGICIGNKAYVLALLGQLEESERIFAQALRAEVLGGEQLYLGTLEDFEVHPIPQDEKFREIVIRQWASYQQELKGSSE